MSASEPCTDCDKIRLERQLDAEEAVRASARELKKLEKEHQQTLESADAAALVAVRQARVQADADLGKLFHESLIDVAKESIERSRDSAKYVQTAAAAIAALYTGALGLAFSVSERPLPIRGVAATVFLGLSVALATAYLAYVSKAPTPAMYSGGESLAELQLNRTGFFTSWISAIINNRRWAIRASVFSLAIGVAFIPVGFVATRQPTSIPVAPTAPAIPAAAGAGNRNTVTKSAEAQNQAYAAASTARNEAIKTNTAEASKKASDERQANHVTLICGILGLLLVAAGPALISLRESEIARKREPNAACATQ